MTVYNIGTPAKSTQAIGLGWKYALPVLEDQLPALELRLAAGQMLPINLRGKGVGLWSYGLASARLPGLETRLTAGISNGPRQLFGCDTTHFMGSVEQPLEGLGRLVGGPVGRVLEHGELVAEWFAGDHEFGDFVPGLSLRTEDDWIFILGYKFSNQPGTRDDGVIIEIGKTF